MTRGVTYTHAAQIHNGPPRIVLTWNVSISRVSAATPIMSSHTSETGPTLYSEEHVKEAMDLTQIYAVSMPVDDEPPDVDTIRDLILMTNFEAAIKGRWITGIEMPHVKHLVATMKIQTTVLSGKDNTTFKGITFTHEYSAVTAALTSLGNINLGLSQKVSTLTQTDTLTLTSTIPVTCTSPQVHIVPYPHVAAACAEAFGMVVRKPEARTSANEVVRLLVTGMPVISRDLIDVVATGIEEAYHGATEVVFVVPKEERSEDDSGYKPGMFTGEIIFGTLGILNLFKPEHTGRAHRRLGTDGARYSTSVACPRLFPPPWAVR